MRNLSVVASIIVLAVITSLVILGFTAEDVHSQGPPHYVATQCISGCFGPPRTQVLTFEGYCDELAAMKSCRVGTVHPIQVDNTCGFVPGCSEGGHPYVAEWGCFLHGCK